MTTWTDIDASRLEPGKPIRSIDGLALRDNPIAITEGASGAPKIAEPAMGDASVATRAIVNGAVTNAKIANGAVTSSKLAVTASETNWVLGRAAGGVIGAVGTYALLLPRRSEGTSGPNGVISAAHLAYTSASGETYASLSPSGTWRNMGNAPTTSSVSLWLRIA